MVAIGAKRRLTMGRPDSNKAYYLDMWTEMLSAFLGWPPAKVMEWAGEAISLDRMDDPADLYYHESPQYWIKDLLIPAPLRQRLSDHDLAVLRARLLDAFADEHYYHFPRGTDWRPFRQRIDAILAEYGARLPHIGGG